MAKDDYDVIVYRVLVYLYGCLKGKTVYEEKTFRAAVMKGVTSEEYIVRVLNMMQEEGLIRGLAIARAWGNVYILASDMSEAEITPDGIRYLKENSTMKKVGDTLREAADIIASLASLLGLFA